MSGFKDVKDFLYTIQRKKNNVGEAKATSGRKNVLNLKILVCVDVSGSISPAQYKQFMEQVNAIKGLSVIKVMETDTAVVALYDYEKTRGVKIARLGGGGGTEFTPAFRKAKELEPDAILFMTDGCVGDSNVNPGVPVGWVLSPGGVKPPFKFGDIVRRLT